MRFNIAGLNEEYGLKSLKSFLQRVGFHPVSYEHTGLIFIRFYFVFNEGLSLNDKPFSLLRYSAHNKKMELVFQLHSMLFSELVSYMPPPISSRCFMNSSGLSFLTLAIRRSSTAPLPLALLIVSAT